MADLKERLEAEFENIAQALAALTDVKSLESLSQLELAGVAALLHNFYNGTENLLKQVLLHMAVDLPAGPTWHRDLLDLAGKQEVISKVTVQALRPYLAFRHFFSHAYALDLNPGRMAPLVSTAQGVYQKVRQDLQRFTGQ